MTKMFPYQAKAASHMHAELQEISNIYKDIHHYIMPKAHIFLNFTEEDKEQWRKEREAALAKYHCAIEKARQLIPLRSPEDIIIAYNEGSELLQMNLSGHMGHDFSDLYIPVMIDALRQSHVHTARIFLYTLSHQLNTAAISILIEMMNSPEPLIRREAILNAAELHLTETIPYIQQRITDEVEEVATYAYRSLEKLKDSA